MRFLLSRLWLYLTAAVFAVSVNFALPRLLPGDAAGAMAARFRGQLTPQALEALQKAFGVDEGPWWRQYLVHWRRLLTFDFGTSLSQFPTPVSELVGSGLGWTLLVAGSGLVLAFLIGTALGAAAAWRRGGFVDAVMLPFFVFVGGLPYFWLAMGALSLLGFELRWFPLRHAYDADLAPGWTLPFVVDVLRHAALPVATVVVASLGGWMLGMRNAMVTVMATETVALGRAKGLSPLHVAWSYAARNALLPSVTGFGMALGFVLGGALLTEVVFAYPGLGYLLVQAVRAQDFPLMQGLFLVVTLSVLGANLLVDVVTLAVDPRLRGGRGR